MNAQNREDTELGRLMHDMSCKNADEMHSKVLAARVRELKETQEGVDSMCVEMDKIYSEGEKRGEKDGSVRVSARRDDYGVRCRA